MVGESGRGEAAEATLLAAEATLPPDSGDLAVDDPEDEESSLSCVIDRRKASKSKAIWDKEAGEPGRDGTGLVLSPSMGNAGREEDWTL